MKKLPAGCLLEVACGGEPRVRRYYQLSYQPTLHALDEKEAAERVRAAVEDAVRVRLMSDVPLGAFLSGGLDSSIVVACMARATSRPVQTFSVGFVGAEVDELPFARIIAQRFGTDHHELVVDPDMTRFLPSIVRHHGEPFADTSTLPTRYLCEMTRKHVTVALSGDGGDEAFGGYRRYLWGDLAARLSSWPRPLAALARKDFASTPGARAGAIRTFGRRLAEDDAARYLSLICHFSREEQEALYGPKSARVAGIGCRVHSLSPALASQRGTRQREPVLRSRCLHLSSRRHLRQSGHCQHDLWAGGTRPIRRSRGDGAGRGPARPAQASARQGQVHP